MVEDRTRTIDARRRGSGVPTGRIRVLVAAPQRLLLQALSAVLDAEDGIQVLGSACCPREALRWALAARPDVTVLDAALPRLDGRHVATVLHGEAPALRLVTLADPAPDDGHDDGHDAAAARVAKSLDTRQLVDVLWRVAAGERPGDVGDLAPRAPERPATHRDALTSAEVLVLQYLAHGATNRELADLTECSEKTVRNRLTEIYGKLGLRNRTQAALYAVRHGIVTLADTGPA